MKQRLIQKQADSENEIVFVPVSIEIYKYYELLKRKYITVFKEEINKTIYYLGDNFVQVKNASGNFNTTYYYHDGNLIADKDKGGNKRYYHPDHLGSTSLITNASGGIVEETFYLPFGDILSGGSESRFNYNSKEKDSTGLNYYGARYYKSTQSQFIQPDSIIQDVYNPQSLNRYSYVLNNPYKYVDPSGELGVEAILGFIGFVAAVDYGVEIVKGILEGKSFSEAYESGSQAAGQSVYNVVTHPVETAITIGDGAVLGEAIGGVLGRIGKGVSKVDDVGKGISEISPRGEVSSLSNVNQNKINHILQEGHNWGKVVDNPNDWNQVSSVIDDVVKTGG